MVQCPGCQKSLPDWATQCQFCGSPIKAVPGAKRLASEDHLQTGSGLSSRVTQTLYVVMSSAWLVLGIITFVLVVFVSPSAHKQSGPGVFGAISGAIAAFQVLLGIGLLARVDLVRGIVNVICWISIVIGLLGLLGDFTVMLFFGPLGFLLVLFDIIRVAINASMVWLIGETDAWVR